MSADEQKGSMWMAIVAALVQLAGLTCLSGGVLGAFLLQHELFDAAGASAWVVVGATGLAAIANAVLVFFAARGAPIPAAVPVAIASLPWIAGMVGQWTGAGHTAEAIAAVNPDDAEIIAMMGFAEASTSRILGAAFAASNLCAAATGLGLAALARRAPGRLPLAALVGLLALPAGFLPLLGLELLRNTTPALILPALALALATGLAAAAAGKDRPARSGGLAVAAAFAGVLAYVGTATATIHSQVFEMLSAVANVNPADKLLILTTGAQEISQGAVFVWIGAAVAALCAVAVAAFAAARAGGVAPLSSSAAVTLLVALAVLGVDRAVPRLGGRRIESARAPATSEPLPRLAWVVGPGSLPIDGVLGRDGALEVAGKRLKLVEWDLIAAAMRPRTPMARDPADDSRVAKLITRKSSVAVSPRFGAALAEGCTAEQVLALARAADRAGIATLALVGRRLRDATDPALLDQLDGLVPLRLGKSQSLSALEVRLPGALEGSARVRPARFEKGALRVDAVDEREGFQVTLAEETNFPFEPYAPAPDGEEIVGISAAGAVPLGALLTAVARLRMTGYEVVLYPDGAPVARP